jgi:Rieske Fe-S protein
VSKDRLYSPPFEGGVAAHIKGNVAQPLLSGADGLVTRTTIRCEQPPRPLSRPHLLQKEANNRPKLHFPVSSEEDSFITRREFTKFLGLASLAFFAGTLLAAGRKLWKRVMARDTAGVRVATFDEIAVGGYKLFRYPTENDPCILLRLEPEKFVAFNQSCTHLSCPVLFNAVSRQLECPCHQGFFSAEDGRVLAGPPKRPLDALSVSLRGDQIWVKHESES